VANWQACLRDIRHVQTEIMRTAPWRDAGLVPNPRASARAIASAEKRIGRPLPPAYREFLAEHDGWPRFFEGATLFGTANLGLRLYDQAIRAAFEAAETPVPDVGPPSRAAERRVLIAFGADVQATTLFAFEGSCERADGELEVVAWINEIGVRRDSFESFLELVLELADAELHSRLGARQRAPISEIDLPIVGRSAAAGHP
jgi:hypothetical protein